MIWLPAVVKNGPMLIREHQHKSRLWGAVTVPSILWASESRQGRLMSVTQRVQSRHCLRVSSRAWKETSMCGMCMVSAVRIYLSESVTTLHSEGTHQSTITCNINNSVCGSGCLDFKVSECQNATSHRREPRYAQSVADVVHVHLL